MNTLLFKYIDAEISKYVEPVREGTAKGDPIGLSSIKYKSTLLFLTNLKGKEIAEAGGVSYGLLRVWRTEEPYLNTIEHHTKTFAGLVAKHLVESVKGTSSNLNSKIMNQFAQDFADITLYSDGLMTEIYNQVTARSYKETTFYRFMPYVCFIFALRKWNNLYCHSTDEVIVNARKAGRHENNITYFDVFEAIQRPWTPDKEEAERAKISFLKEI